MFSLELPVIELMFRAAVVYIALLLLIRIIGKRHVGEMAPFDLVVLLILSDGVQNSLIGGDRSLLGGLIVAGSLIGLNQAVSYLSFRSKGFSRVVEGTPRILIRNGKICRETLANERVTLEELREAVRRGGCTNVKRVHYAILENDGKISVGVRPEFARRA